MRAVAPRRRKHKQGRGSTPARARYARRKRTLFTSAQSRSVRALTAHISAATSASSVISHLIATILRARARVKRTSQSQVSVQRPRPPAHSGTAAFKSATASGVRHAAYTTAPSRASRSARPLPKPLSQPVTLRARARGERGVQASALIQSGKNSQNVLARETHRPRAQKPDSNSSSNKERGSGSPVRVEERWQCH